MTVKVVTDSASDITREDAEKFGIEIVPVYLRFGEQVYRDNIDITGDEFYTRLTSDPVHPSTASPSPGDFSTIYEKLSAETDEIVSIHVTSKHSSVYSSALAVMK
jgi:DegV family protein with EDD domain